MEKTMKKIKLPEVLAFERKLEASDALMYAGIWGNGDGPNMEQEWSKIKITKRRNRSTQSSYGIADSKKSQPNPVAAENDDANLPTGKDTLRVNFTVRIIGNLGKPFACNAPDFEKAIIKKVMEFKGDNGSGLQTLAFRYAYNIANGRFLWRNRVCAEKVKIFVESNKSDMTLDFDAHSFALNDFDKGGDNENIKKLSEIIQYGLASVDDFVFLKINAYVKLGDNQHVFPSQEMNMGETKKVLFQLENCAAIHNVKIGNALRTIDNWYEDADFPIAAEPYGAVTQRGEAFRKTKNDLYTLMLSWVNDDTDALDNNGKNFVVANLLRGGVFGGKGE